MKPKASFLLPLLPLLTNLISAEPFTPYNLIQPPNPNEKPRAEHQKSPLTNSTEIIMSSLSPRLLPESEADEICLSNAFAPTIENWWESGATEWIKSYTLSNADNPRFKELGLIDHLAEVFLKKTNFKCGIDTPHRCAVECQEVVARVEDREDARVVWFVLKSAGHVAEVTKVVHCFSPRHSSLGGQGTPSPGKADTLTAAQINMAEIVPVISRTFFWTPGTDDHTWAIIFTHTINTLSSLFMNFFPMLRSFIHINASLEALAAASVASFMDATRVFEEAQNQLATSADSEGYDHDANVKAVELAAEKKGIMEWRCKIMVNTVKAARLGLADMVVGQIGQGIGRAFGRANWEMSSHGTHSGSERTREGNELALEAFIRSSCMRARESLKKGTEILFNGAMMDTDGSSLFSNFTMGGNFLPDISSDAAKWRDSGIEEKITRGLMLKTLNAALNSQQVYITCTHDYRRTSTSYQPSVESKPPVGSCKRDNSGPQDFKACINDYVCYLYKWNNRGWALSWRNERIFGSDFIDEEPWSTNITDIITSSVSAYFDGVRGYGSRDMSALGRGIFSSLSAGRNVESLWDPTTPGMFTVPVCFSKYNWATVIDGYRFPQNGLFDTQPRNSIKNLPCNCGPWGRDTENVWKEIGLWNAGTGKDREYFNDYTASKCGYQIYDKIKDPIERYVAFCRVHIHGRMKDRIRYVGRDWQCNIVIDILEKMGYPEVWELAPEVYHIIYCKVVRHPGRDMCRGFRDLPLGLLLNRMGVRMPGVGVGEDKAAVGAKTAAVGNELTSYSSAR